MSTPPHPETAAVFRALAEVVYAEDDFAAVHEALCAAAGQLVPGCDRASLMLRDRGRLSTACATDDLAAHVDRLERELGEGPCLDAIEEDGSYVQSSLSDGSRWPRLAERVLAETPVRGMAGFQLRVSDTRVGALNMFADRPHALTEESLHAGMMVAAFASVTLRAAHEREDARTLRHGLESNREIGKAVGLMMAFHKLDDAAAFGLLRRTSQDMNLKIAEVARRVVHHHNQREPRRES